jgi:hypothetical protein
VHTVVGRDVLLGVGFGVLFALILRIINFASADDAFRYPGEVELLLGLRHTMAVVLEEAPYAIRNVLLYFFMLFVLRVVFRNQWAAAIGFTVFWGIVNALGSSSPSWIGALGGFLFFGTAAVIALALWGFYTSVSGRVWRTSG